MAEDKKLQAYIASMQFVAMASNIIGKWPNHVPANRRTYRWNTAYGVVYHLEGSDVFYICSGENQFSLEDAEDVLMDLMTGHVEEDSHPLQLGFVYDWHLRTPYGTSSFRAALDGCEPSAEHIFDDDGALKEGVDIVGIFLKPDSILLYLDSKAQVELRLTDSRPPVLLGGTRFTDLRADLS